jgi:hypothetical protein
MMLKSYWTTLTEERGIEDNRQRANIVWKHAFSVAVLEQTNLPLKKIGQIIGKDHATILHAKKLHDTNYTYDDKYRQCYQLISNEIADIIDEYDAEVKKAIRSRTTILNPSLDKLEREYELKLKNQQRKADERYEELNRKYEFITQQLKIQTARANKLNEEAKRLKNLL